MDVWLRRKSVFYHDWLKNTFLSRLVTFIVFAQRGDAGVADVLRYLTDDLPQWANGRKEAHWLIDNVANELSPKLRVREFQDKGSWNETIEWLGQILDLLWRRKHEDLLVLVDESRAQLDIIDSKYASVCTELAAVRECSEESMSEVCSVLVEFRDALRILRDQMRRLPSKASVI